MAWNGDELKTTDFWLDHAIQQILKDYSVRVRPKWKSLLKFGAHATLGTSRGTIWAHGADELNETYASANSIDSISSSHADDTQTVLVEGHTIDGSGDFTFVERTVVLNGQNRVAFDGVARSSRFRIPAPTVALSGDVYVYENTTISSGVPVDTSKVHLKGPASDNQSLKAASTLSKIDYLAVTQIHCSVGQKTSASVDFRFEVRDKGGIFSSKIPGSAKSDGPAFSEVFRPFYIVPANADFRITGVASTTNVAVDAWINGFLLIKDD